MSRKHKITAYLPIFEENLEKMIKKIKQARKDGELSKEQVHKLVAEAKQLRDRLRNIE